MERHKLFLFVVAASIVLWGGYNLICAECGELNIACNHSVVMQPCEKNSFSLTCAQITTVKGLFTCPQCPAGFHSVRCESYWFGLIKESVCVKEVEQRCGNICTGGLKPIAYKPCIAKTQRACCQIPTLNLQVITSIRKVFVNEEVPLVVKWDGNVTTLSIDYGNGTIKTLTVNNTHTKTFTLSYPIPGRYVITITARSCLHCTNPVIEKKRVILKVE